MHTFIKRLVISAWNRGWIGTPAVVRAFRFLNLREA